MQIDEFVKSYARFGKAPENRALEKTAELRFLLDLIDLSRKHSKPSFKLPTHFKPITQTHTLTLLENLFSHNFSKREAKTFLDQLVYNPDFLFQLEPYLSTPSTAEELTEEERAQCHYLPDEEIYNRVTERLTAQPKTKRIQHSKSAIRVIKDWLATANAAPARFATAAVAVFIIASSAYLFWPQNQTTLLYKTYFPRSEEPYLGELNMDKLNNGQRAELRSNSELQATGSQKLRSLFTIAKSNYLSGDFEKSIRVLNMLEGQIATTNAPAQFITNIKRDMFFYLGMSYLGQSNGKSTTDLNQAISHLKMALTISEKHNLDSMNEILFFLGLAHTLNNQEDTAKAYLTSINPNSSFYDQSVTLLD